MLTGVRSWHLADAADSSGYVVHSSALKMQQVKLYLRQLEPPTGVEVSSEIMPCTGGPRLQGRFHWGTAGFYLFSSNVYQVLFAVINEDMQLW